MPSFLRLITLQLHRVKKLFSPVLHQVYVVFATRLRLHNVDVMFTSRCRIYIALKSCSGRVYDVFTSHYVVFTLHYVVFTLHLRRV